ncbi:MAG: DUF4175 domain-containing protein, partial [Nitrospirota bacterium]|nr:DUF4175 domain-containing protein [Nitrospirota bacterium]
MNRFDPRQSWAFRRRLGLARAAGAFEAFWPAIWPCAAVVGLFLIISLFGLWAWLPMWLHALGLVGFAGALLWTLARARTALRWPDRDAGLGRLEQVNELPHQPLRSIGDRLSGGGEDALTATLWRRHQKRLTQMLSGLRVGLPQSDLPRRDPWALRAAILLLLLVALVEAGNMAPHRLVQAFELHRSDQLAIAPTEVTLWVTPPTYTGRPPIRLEVEAPSVDETVVAPEPSVVALPAGSEALAQLHHLAAAAEAYTLGLDEHQEPFAAVGENSAEASLLIERSGQLRVGSATEDFGSWLIEAVPDQVPEIDFAEPPSATQRGALRSHFAATDDYGVISVALLLSRSGD